MISGYDFGDEMILEGYGFLFGGLALVHFRWCELGVNVGVVNELLEGVGCFIVESL